MKDFRQQIQFFEQKLRSKEPFAYVRYSDGELNILMDFYTELSDIIKFGPPDNMKQINYAYAPEDHKLFEHLSNDMMDIESPDVIDNSKEGDVIPLLI